LGGEEHRALSEITKKGEEVSGVSVRRRKTRKNVVSVFRAGLGSYGPGGWGAMHCGISISMIQLPLPWAERKREKMVESWSFKGFPKWGNLFEPDGFRPWGKANLNRHGSSVTRTSSLWYIARFRKLLQ